MRIKNFSCAYHNIFFIINYFLCYEKWYCRRRTYNGRILAHVRLSLESKRRIGASLNAILYPSVVAPTTPFKRIRWDLAHETIEFPRTSSASPAVDEHKDRAASGGFSCLHCWSPGRCLLPWSRLMSRISGSIPNKISFILDYDRPQEAIFYFMSLNVPFLSFRSTKVELLFALNFRVLN